MKKLFLSTVFVFFSISSIFSQYLYNKSLISYQEITVHLSEGVSFTEWKRYFDSEYVKAYNKTFNGEIEIIPLDGWQGKCKGSFSLIMLFSSVDVKNKYFPLDDIVSGSYKQKLKSINQIIEGLNKLGKWNRTFYSYRITL